MPEPLLRALDLTIARRVEGLLPGDHRSSLLGRGSELAQIRPYEPVEDDVRQIDWNVTARTGTPHVRIHLAERALVTWLVLDTSPSMTFGTAERRKADVAEGASLAIGYAATRRGNRLGLVTFGDDTPAHAAGAAGTGRPARPAARAAQGGGRGRARRARAARPRSARRSSASAHWRASGRTSSSSPTSAARATGAGRCSTLGGRHHVVAVEIRDAREQELPKFGQLRLVDPETGRQLKVDTSSERLRARVRRGRRAGARARSRPRSPRPGARHVVLSTHGDWLRELTGFLRHAGAQ